MNPPREIDDARGRDSWHPPVRPKLAAQLIGLCAVVCAAVIGACELEPVATVGVEELAQILVVEPPALVLSVGDRLQLRATALLANGEQAADYEFYWSSSRSDVAVVQEDGTVIAVAAGGAKITAEAEKKGKGLGREGAPGRLKKEVDVTVDNIEVASVEIVPADTAVQLGSSVQLEAVLKDADGNLLEGRTVTWESSDPSIASVDFAGRVSGNTLGSVAVTGSTEGHSDTATVSVVASPILRVIIWPQDVDLPNGQRAQLYLAMQMEDGTTDCEPKAPSQDPAVLFNANSVAGCDSAIALLISGSAGSSGTSSPTEKQRDEEPNSKQKVDYLDREND